MNQVFPYACPPLTFFLWPVRTLPVHVCIHRGCGYMRIHACMLTWWHACCNNKKKKLDQLRRQDEQPFYQEGPPGQVRDIFQLICPAFECSQLYECWLGEPCWKPCCHLVKEHKPWVEICILLFTAQTAITAMLICDSTHSACPWIRLGYTMCPNILLCSCCQNHSLLSQRSHPATGHSEYHKRELQ